MTSPSAISLFSSGGIGDLALRAAGFDILVSNEIREERHAVFEYNFPNAVSLKGDIWNLIDDIESRTRAELGDRPLTLLYATPPCQGMSKNGRGKLLSEIRAGRKPPLDERNRLVIPTIDLAKRLNPEIVLLENVPEMADTIIVGPDGQAEQIVDFVRRQLGTQYHGAAEVVEFADYGVPQCRQRLITVLSRHPALVAWFRRWGTFLPPKTHSKDGRLGTDKWVTVRDAISSLPPLDAGNATTARSDIPFHQVPLLDEVKYWWVKNTKPDRSAFDNQCTQCHWDKNRAHTARHDVSGINRTSTQTPLFCEKCGELLPRPHVERNGVKSIMRGFTSAYKRMSYDKPASALTRNLSYACSDNKLHPEQNRVLSLYEAFRIHSLDRYKYEWKRRDGRRVSDKVVREIIGESIPPWGLQQIVEHLNRVRNGDTRSGEHSVIGPLFAAQEVGTT